MEEVYDDPDKKIREVDVDERLRERVLSDLQEFWLQEDLPDRQKTDVMNLILDLTHTRGVSAAELMGRAAVKAFMGGDEISGDCFISNTLCEFIFEKFVDEEEYNLKILFLYIASLIHHYDKSYNQRDTELSKYAINYLLKGMREYQKGEISLHFLEQKFSIVLREVLKKESYQGRTREVTLKFLASLKGHDLQEGLRWDIDKTSLTIKEICFGMIHSEEEYMLNPCKAGLKSSAAEVSLVNGTTLKLDNRATKHLRSFFQQLKCPYDKINWYVRIPKVMEHKLAAIVERTLDSYIHELAILQALEKSGAVIESSPLRENQKKTLVGILDMCGIEKIEVERKEDAYFIRLPLVILNNMDELFHTYSSNLSNSAHRETLHKKVSTIDTKNPDINRALGVVGNVKAVTEASYGIGSDLTGNLAPHEIAGKVSETGLLTFEALGVAMAISSLVVAKSDQEKMDRAVDLTIAGSGGSTKVLSHFVPGLFGKTPVGPIFAVVNLIIDDVRFATKYLEHAEQYRDLLVRVGKRCSNIVLLYNEIYKIYSQVIEKQNEIMRNCQSEEERGQALEKINECTDGLRAFYLLCTNLISQIKLEVVELNAQKQIDTERAHAKRAIGVGVGALLTATVAFGPVAPFVAAGVALGGVIFGTSGKLFLDIKQRTLIDNPVRMVQGIYQRSSLILCSSDKSNQKMVRSAIEEQQVITFWVTYPSVNPLSGFGSVATKVDKNMRRYMAHNLQLDDLDQMKLLDTYSSTNEIHDQIKLFDTTVLTLRLYLQRVLYCVDHYSYHIPNIENIEEIIRKIALWNNNLRHCIMNSREYLLSQGVADIPEYLRKGYEDHIDSELFYCLMSVEKLYDYQKKLSEMESSDVEDQFLDSGYFLNRAKEIKDLIKVMNDHVYYVIELNQDLKNPKKLLGTEELIRKLTSMVNDFSSEVVEFLRNYPDHERHFEEWREDVVTALDNLTENLRSLSPIQDVFETTFFDVPSSNIQEIETLQLAPGLNRPLQGDEFAILEYRFRGTERVAKAFMYGSIEDIVSAMKIHTSKDPARVTKCYIMPMSMLTRELVSRNYRELDYHLRGIERALEFYEQLLSYNALPKNLRLANIPEIVEFYLEQLSWFNKNTPDNLVSDLSDKNANELTLKSVKLQGRFEKLAAEAKGKYYDEKSSILTQLGSPNNSNN